jgi:hypothetical protein
MIFQSSRCWHCLRRPDLCRPSRIKCECHSLVRCGFPETGTKRIHHCQLIPRAGDFSAALGGTYITHDTISVFPELFPALAVTAVDTVLETYFPIAGIWAVAHIVDTVINLLTGWIVFAGVFFLKTMAHFGAIPAIPVAVAEWCTAIRGCIDGRFSGGQFKPVDVAIA